MPDLSPLFPHRPVPAFAVPLVGGGRFDLAAEAAGRFTLAVFYRGLHCLICGQSLGELAGLLEAFAQRGVGVVAISGDTAERAAEAHRR